MTIDFYPTISRGEFGPYMNCEKILISAASFANYEVLKYGHVRKKIFEPTRKACIQEIAVDCGGYVATRKWGDYRFTVEQYTKWLHHIQPTWAATFDYCCESDISTDIHTRIHKTVDNAYAMSDIPGTWCWVPTIQGYQLSDYLYCADLLEELITHQLTLHNPHFRVGIGTLCRRNSGQEIASLVYAITEKYPHVPFHLWGVKQNAFSYFSHGIPTNIKSFDTAAWNGMYGRNRTKWKDAKMKQREWCFKVALPSYREKLSHIIG